MASVRLAEGNAYLLHECASPNLWRDNRMDSGLSQSFDLGKIKVGHDNDRDRAPRQSAGQQSYQPVTGKVVYSIVELIGSVDIHQHDISLDTIHSLR
jgi:hypothetical protein